MRFPKMCGSHGVIGTHERITYWAMWRTFFSEKITHKISRACYNWHKIFYDVHALFEILLHLASFCKNGKPYLCNQWLL